MRISVDGLDTVIEGEVIDGKLLDGKSGVFDLESAFTVRCDDGVFSDSWLDGRRRGVGEDDVS